MRSAFKQQGMTFISVLVLLMIGGFFALLLLKLGPIYLENYKVKSVLSTLETQQGLKASSAAKIRSAITKRLYINEVRRLDEKAIKVKRTKGGHSIEINYEVRENIASNVDAVVSFHEKAEFKAR